MAVKFQPPSCRYEVRQDFFAAIGPVTGFIDSALTVSPPKVWLFTPGWWAGTGVKRVAINGLHPYGDISEWPSVAMVVLPPSWRNDRFDTDSSQWGVKAVTKGRRGFQVHEVAISPSIDQLWFQSVGDFIAMMLAGKATSEDFPVSAIVIDQIQGNVNFYTANPGGNGGEFQWPDAVLLANISRPIKPDFLE